MRPLQEWGGHDATQLVPVWVNVSEATLVSDEDQDCRIGVFRRNPPSKHKLLVVGSFDQDGVHELQQDLLEFVADPERRLDRSALSSDSRSVRPMMAACRSSRELATAQLWAATTTRSSSGFG